MSVLSALVEDARERYLKASEPHVIVHTADMVRATDTSTSFSAPACCLYRELLIRETPYGRWRNARPDDL